MEEFLKQMIVPIVSTAVAFGGCFALLKLLEKNVDGLAERFQSFTTEKCPADKKAVYDYVNLNVQTLNEKIDKNQQTIMDYLMDIKGSIGELKK